MTYNWVDHETALLRGTSAEDVKTPRINKLIARYTKEAIQAGLAVVVAGVAATVASEVQARGFTPWIDSPNPESNSNVDILGHTLEIGQNSDVGFYVDSAGVSLIVVDGVPQLVGVGSTVIPGSQFLKEGGIFDLSGDPNNVLTKMDDGTYRYTMTVGGEQQWTGLRYFVMPSGQRITLKHLNDLKNMPGYGDGVGVVTLDVHPPDSEEGDSRTVSLSYVDIDHPDGVLLREHQLSNIEILQPAGSVKNAMMIPVSMDNTTQMVILPSQDGVSDPRLENGKWVATGSEGDRLFLDESSGTWVGMPDYLKLNKDGSYNLTLSTGEIVKLDASEVSLSGENGTASAEGYYMTPDGWRMSPEKMWQKQVEKWGIDPTGVTSGTDADGKLVVKENKNGKVIYNDGNWEPLYLGKMIQEQGMCKVTPFVGTHIGSGTPPNVQKYVKEYGQKLVDAYLLFVKQRVIQSSGMVVMDYYMGDGCWGSAFYRQKGVDQSDVWYFWKDSSGTTKYEKVFLNF